MHRNKLVKELSGFYSRSELGGCSGEFAHSSVEATREDLTVAKLVLARFLPPVVFDGDPDLLRETCDATSSRLNLGKIHGMRMNDGRYGEKPPLTDSQRRWIEEHNDLDMELYEYALALVRVSNDELAGEIGEEVSDELRV